MSLEYEELDYRSTPLGMLMLRRRRLPQLGDTDIFEVKLGKDFLMSSLYHKAEYELAKLGLAPAKGDRLDVVVGGLGLGYTAASALEDSRVGSLVVIEYLEAVIDWHRNGLVPLGSTLTKDKRCRLQQADFFELSRNTKRSFDLASPNKKHDAILLDIDHTPTHVLRQSNTRFYSKEGLRELKQHLKPDGIFALWANGEPDPSFVAHLEKVFDSAAGHAIVFDNPINGGESTGAVYVAK